MIITARLYGHDVFWKNFYTVITYFCVVSVISKVFCCTNNWFLNTKHILVCCKKFKTNRNITDVPQ